MGAGKSAVGRELAARLAVPFRDSDALIAAAFGPVVEIFAERGEAGFRALEAEAVVRELGTLGDTPKVLALGGGAVLDAQVRAALRDARHVVWLTAPAGELWRRVQSDAGAERPLARDEAAFVALLAARRPLYRDVATAVADTAGRTPAEVAGSLAAWLSGEPSGTVEVRVVPREGAA